MVGDKAVCLVASSVEDAAFGPFSLFLSLFFFSIDTHISIGGTYVDEERMEG